MVGSRLSCCSIVIRPSGSYFWQHIVRKKFLLIVLCGSGFPAAIITIGSMIAAGKPLPQSMITIVCLSIPFIRVRLSGSNRNRYVMDEFFDQVVCAFAF